MTDKLAAMKTLIQEINKHNHNYYTLDQPAISDAEWDALYDKLTKLEQETGVTLPASPTQRVGGDMLKGFEPHRHLARLWSLDKAQNAEDLANMAYTRAQADCRLQQQEPRNASARPVLCGGA